MMGGDDAARLADLAQRAHVYGFPLVFNLQQVQRYVTTGVGANPAAPFNTFSHARMPGPTSSTAPMSRLRSGGSSDRLR